MNTTTTTTTAPTVHTIDAAALRAALTHAKNAVLLASSSKPVLRSARRLREVPVDAAFAAPAQHLVGRQVAGLAPVRPACPTGSVRVRGGVCVAVGAPSDLDAHRGLQCGGVLLGERDHLGFEDAFGAPAGRVEGAGLEPRAAFGARVRETWRAHGCHRSSTPTGACAYCTPSLSDGCSARSKAMPC